MELSENVLNVYFHRVRRQVNFAVLVSKGRLLDSWWNFALPRVYFELSRKKFVAKILDRGQPRQ